MASPSSDDDQAGEATRLRRAALTPEQRRLLGKPRQIEGEAQEAPPPSPRVRAPSAPAEEARSHTASVRAQETASRAIELRHALVVIGLLVFLLAAFYAGRRFDYLRYQIVSRRNAQQLEGSPDKFPNLTAQELIETGLTAERRGDWPEASERYLSAKRRNLQLPGILFRVGKGFYDRNDLAGADLAFSHALRFGENVPASNYYRGLIAIHRHDVPAAIRFFEAASNADPFLADLYYNWGEALRLDFKPRDAIKRYEQAIMRSPSGNDIALCSFKIRLALIEAAESGKVAADLERVREAGPLTVDWIMTDAALRLQENKIPEAAQLIAQARLTGLSGLFLTCAGDTVFLRAAQANPEIVAALRPPAIPAP